MFDHALRELMEERGRVGTVMQGLFSMPISSMASLDDEPAEEYSQLVRKPISQALHRALGCEGVELDLSLDAAGRTFNGVFRYRAITDTMPGQANLQALERAAVRDQTRVMDVLGADTWVSIGFYVAHAMYGASVIDHHYEVME